MEYLKEEEEKIQLDEGRKKINVLSPNEKTRKALYSLKRQLDSIDQLSDFSYTGRRGKNQASAEFTIEDTNKFHELKEAIETDHGVTLELLT